MTWGMYDMDIYGQEGRTADRVLDGGGIRILEYDGIHEFGFDCRLDYRMDYAMTCTSAEYIITADVQRRSKLDCRETVSSWLDEFYAEPSPDPNGGTAEYRKTRTADIYFYKDNEDAFHILFRMPEGYLEEKNENYTVTFNEDQQ